jgi:hypothetical protein
MLTTVLHKRPAGTCGKGGAKIRDRALRQGVVVYVVGALLLIFTVIAAAGVFCPIRGEASFRELLIRDCLIEQPMSPCACVFKQK